MYKEKFFKVVQHRRTGVFGLKHHWSFVLIGPNGNELTMDMDELLQTLKHRPDAPNQDVFMCVNRAVALFREGRPEWVGYPSGAVVGGVVK